jgi:digeranylgeranylglycerophospholipid reductase
LLVGDAAHHTNPLTGGGIASAMLSGKLAAEQLDRAFKRNDLSENYLREYHRECWREFGRSYEEQRRIRQWVLGLAPREQQEFHELAKVAAEQGKARAFLKFPLRAARTAKLFASIRKDVPAEV